MFPGKNGFSVLARDCFSAPVSGQVENRMPKILSRMLLYDTGDTKELWPETLYRSCLPPFDGRHSTWRERTAGEPAARTEPPEKTKRSTTLGSNLPLIPTPAAKRSRPPSTNFRPNSGKLSRCAFGVNSLSSRSPISFRFHRTRPRPAIATACSPCGKR